MRPDRSRRLPYGPRLARTTAGLALVAASALLLTGCQASPKPAASASQSAGSKASAPAAAASTPTATPTPVTLTCDQVLTTEQLSKMTPAIAAASGFTPEKGSNAAKAVADAGVACGYTNGQTGNTVSVSIARPTPADLTALKNAAITDSNVVPTYGVPPKVMGYFAVSQSVGVAQAFTGDYWVVVESKDYIEPGDASQVLTTVLGNLPA